MIMRLSQGPVAPEPPTMQAADPRPPTPAQSDDHKTPPKELKSPEQAHIEPQPHIKQASSPPKPSQAREPKIPEAPIRDVRWSLRLDEQQKSSIDALFSADSPLTDMGSPLKSPPPRSSSPKKKGNEMVLRSSAALTNSLGKRKRGGGVSKRRKKAATTTSNTAAKGKGIVQCDESDQPPVMVCSP